MARPTKYTDEAANAVVAVLLEGSPRRAACAQAGICEDTLANWLKRYSDFSDAVKKAEAQAVTRRVARIDRAGEGGFLISRKVTVNHRSQTETTEETYAQPQWQADAWLLERRYPEDFGRKDKVEVNIQQLVRQRAEAEGLNPDEVMAEVEALLKAVK